jgi:hypothetical protein
MQNLVFQNKKLRPVSSESDETPSGVHVSKTLELQWQALLKQRPTNMQGDEMSRW